MVFYNVGDKGFIDYDDLFRKIFRYHPRLVLAGASAYSRIIDFERIRKLIDDSAWRIRSIGEAYETPYFMVDMAHIAGLVAAGDHPSPFGFADLITTTTHKTLRGPRGGLIFCKPELAKKVDSAVFPCCQGGPLQHVIAGKAVCAEEACTPEFHEYIHHVVENSKAMAEEFKRLGYEIVTDGTDNHLFLIDFTRTHPDLTGKMVQDWLDEHGVTVNKNCVPGETRSPVQTSGIRIGTAAMTTRGFSKADFEDTAREIDRYLKILCEKNKKENNKTHENLLDKI